MVQISLPDDIIRRAESQAAQKGFASLAEYLVELVDQDTDPFAGRTAEVEAALLEGIASGPATEMKDDDWQELRRRVREIHSRSVAGK